MKVSFMRLDIRVFGIMLAFAVSAGAQAYPDTLWIPVTFYDFHPDGSNPEFEPDPHDGDVYTGMVAPTLDAENKPRLGSAMFFNRYIHKWYRPWTPGDFSKPVYTNSGNGQLVEIIQNLDHDTAFKNIVIHDSLPFTHLEDGMYQYEDNSFFMLDDRGFGIEPKDNENQHNYSFTMELHTTFTYEPGQTFDFKGDDDVWAFVDKRLAMDLGGIHTSQEGSFEVDDISGLEPGKKYQFDFFYAERHTNHSTIKITTNIISPPSRLRLYPMPGAPGPSNPPFAGTTQIEAGKEFNLYAHVLDSAFVWRPEYDDLVSWELNDPLGQAVLSSDSGAANTIFTTEAHSELTLTARFEHPDFPGSQSTVELSIEVQPGNEHHIDIQQDSAVVSLRDDDSFDALTLNEEASREELFAVVRDEYGNYIRHADNASWTSVNPGVVTATPAQRKFKGIIEKKGGGVTQVIAAEPGGIADTITVTAVYPGTVLTAAITRDRNGNGYLDAVELQFDSAITLPDGFDPGGLSVTGGGKTFVPTGMSAKGGGRTGTVFILAFQEQQTSALQTDWELTVSGTAPQVAPWSNVPAADGAGAVIQKATHYPGIGQAGDTIRLTLSEPVNCMSLASKGALESFSYFRRHEKQSAQTLGDVQYGACTAEMQRDFVMVFADDGFRVDPETDSLRLVANARDVAENLPHSEGRKEPVLPAGTVNVQAGAAPNPFLPGASLGEQIGTQSSNIFTFYKNIVTPSSKGVLIAISSSVSLQAESDGSYGKADIYDAVGNLVRSGLKVQKANNNTKSLREYGVHWDGANNNGRTVGGGAYLMIARGKDLKGKSFEKRIKIAARIK